MKQVTKHPSTITAAKRRVAREGEFDNGRVLHTWYSMTEDEAENAARDQSIKDPDNVYYVANDDVMNPASERRWRAGKQIDSNCKASTDCHSSCSKKFTKHPSSKRRPIKSASYTSAKIPGPYNKYFEIDPPTEDADLLPGDRIEDYDCTFLAYLAPKPEYEDTLDMWPVLTDLTDYPVCDFVAGRLYPITPEDIHRHLGDTEYLVESSTSTKQFTKHPSKVTAAADILSFKCPGCRNKTLYSTEQDVHRAADVDENELFICDECGGEFRAHPQHDGSIRFTESIESATDVDEIPEFNDWLYDKYGYGDSDMSDDDWEYYHDKYLMETGQSQYMSGNVYSSKQPRVRRQSPHLSITNPTDLVEASTTTKQFTKYPKKVTSAQDSDTYWMAKYTDIDGNQHKILFKFNSSDFDEAEEEMDAVIPEPYTRARLLGRGSLGAERDGFVLVSYDDSTVTASEDVDDYEDDIQEISQEFTSENTSINSGKLPAIFKMIHLEPGTINIDYGGGKFDNVAEYLAPMDVVNLVYDPYNRTPEHNKEVLRTIRKAGGADSATCSNVLNVIKEPEVRRNVLENIRKVVKPEGVVYITVYEGSGRGNEGPTKSGYQLNRKTADYLDEIKEVFPDAIRKGKLIIAHPSGSVASSVECSADVSKKDLLFLAKKAADVTTAEDLEEIISSLLSVDKKLYTKYSEEARSDKSPAAIGKDISDDLYWMTQDDEVTAANCGDATIMSASSVSMKAIHDKILNAASKRLQKSDMGFPLSEIADYLVVEEEETEDGALKIEVRCELSYEGMSKLAEALDPIVARYDKNAYFDMVAPGIMEAFIFNSDIRADSFSPVTADNRNFPEPPLEPPNYDEPKQNNTTDYIVVDLDDDIIVEDNSIDFAADPSFYQESEEWVVEFATDTTLDDPDSVAEHVLELILPQIPNEPGMYRVKGRVTLAYDVSYSSTFRQEGYDDGYEDIDESSVDASFNFKKSEINKLEVGRD